MADVGTKSFRPWSPRQMYLMPPSPTEWLPEGHLAYFILELVERLDLGPIETAIASKDARGERPYTPRLLVALLIYGYCVGIFSSRKLARATYEDVAFLVLAGGAHPHFTTINQFRLEYREVFARLFVQVLRLCRRAGLVKLGHVAVDGTKVLANASKHKAMSYERMQEEDARLRGEINELLANADCIDKEEDERYGVGRSPEDLPEELRRREARLERINRAMEELEQEAAQARAEELRDQASGQRERAADPTANGVDRKRNATRAERSEARANKLDPPDEDPPASTGGDLPHHRVPHTTEGKPGPKAQRNFSDPDSRIMTKDGSYVQAYNAQIVVDEAAQIIVAQAVTNQAPDQEHLLPMLARVEQSLGRRPRRISADAGYYADANVRGCEAANVTPYIAASRTPHASAAQEPPAPPSPLRAAMIGKLQSPEGHAIYSRRKVIAEPPFGQIKTAQGFRRFSLRGILKVRCEWALVSLTHNVLKLFRNAPEIMLGA